MTQRGARHRRLLMVAYYFPPLGGGGIQRSVKFAKYLRRLGWSIDVLTTTDEGFHLTQVDFEDDLEGIHTTRIGNPTLIPSAEALPHPWLRNCARPVTRNLNRLASLLHLPDRLVGWSLRAYRWAANNFRSHRWDAVMTSGPDHSQHLVGLLCKTRLGIPWVADFRDPWTTRVSYRPRTRLHRRLDTALERRVVRDADAVVTATATWREEFVERFPGQSPGRFHTIYNGYDPEDFIGFQATRPEVFTIVHLGSLYSRQDPTPFLDALSTLLSEDPAAVDRLRVVFAGFTSGYIVDDIHRRQLDETVKLTGYLAHEESIGLMASASALLLIVGGGESAAGICPGKVGEYLRSGLPILTATPEGEVTSLLRDRPQVYNSPERDSRAILRSLRQLIAAQPEPSTAASIERDPLLSLFNRQEQAEHLNRILEQITDG